MAKGGENSNMGPGVVSKTGSNGMFEKNDLPMGLMEDEEKTEEKGVYPDRREVKVLDTWSIGKRSRLYRV